jgi:hypothetical protein
MGDAHTKHVRDALPITSRMLGVDLDGSRRTSLLRLAGPSVQTAADGSRTIVWMIKRMINGHPTQDRMTARDQPVERRRHAYTAAAISACGRRSAGRG